MYHPPFSVEFATANQASDFHHDSVEAIGCFSFICICGGESSISNSTSYEPRSKVVSYNDTSNRSHLVGYSLLK
ncbi:hypothetical protein C8J55DRAFT_500286 [Lentinula edodes]|uniref:Uncharacterized protein n=1 Tax=Lentinula lateritia TaxID=40482 RepID=A0A9W9DZT7_9AGAR|nr:hypothetical protein C8J55DRAFT_500286 [Lentinula edodes]